MKNEIPNKEIKYIEISFLKCIYAFAFATILIILLVLEGDWSSSYRLQQKNNKLKISHLKMIVSIQRIVYLVIKTSMGFMVRVRFLGMTHSVSCRQCLFEVYVSEVKWLSLCWLSQLEK